MPHFFIDSNSVSEGIITISDKNDYNHIAKSLRAKIGEKLLLIDENEFQYECEIQKISSSSVETKILKSYKSSRKLDFELYLAQSPLRSDAQTLVVEKATELGITGLFPINTDNCALAKDIIKKKIDKWQKTMFEASKQCERANIPTCFELNSMENAIKSKNFDKILTFTERSAKSSLKSYLNNNPILKSEKVLVIIGPEGGFSPREFEYFKSEKINTVSLGELILKAETATTVALGNIIYEFNNA